MAKKGKKIKTEYQLQTYENAQGKKGVTLRTASTGCPFIPSTDDPGRFTTDLNPLFNYAPVLSS